MNFIIDPHEIPFLIVLLASLIALGFQLAFIFTKQIRKAKKPIRIIASLSLFYVIFIYSSTILDIRLPYTGQGVLSSIGLVFVIIPLIADCIADWRREK